MNASRSTKSFTLALSALFLLSSVTAGAAEVSASAREFDLHLERAMSVLEDKLSIVGEELEAATTLPSRQEPAQTATLTSTAVQELWRSDQAAYPQDASGSSSGKKRSWLKKKWWIPVLAAVVVGAAVGGGDGDDNTDDEED